MAAQQCIRSMGEERCILHPEEKLTFECTDCEGELACMICVSTVHQSHTLVAIKHRRKSKLVNIEQFIKHTKQEAIPDVEKDIRLTIQTLQENEQLFQNEILEVKKQDKRLKELVHRYSGKKVVKLQHLLKETLDLLNNHKKYLEKLQQEMERDTKECEHIVKSGQHHDVLVHDAETQIVRRKSHVKIAKIPIVTSPTFSPCKYPGQYIEKALGELTNHTEHSGGKNTAQVVSEYNFLDQPKTLNESPTSYEVQYNSISCAPDNTTWVLDIEGKVHRYDLTGKEKQTLSADVKLWRMCFHPSTWDMFGIAVKDKSIRRVNTRKGTTSVMFYTRKPPFSIGCTNDNHFVVGSGDLINDEVSMFSLKGEIIHTYTIIGYYTPEITICGTTNRVALVSHDVGAVTVLDHTLKKLYVLGRQGTSFINTAAFLGRYLLVGDDVNKNIKVFDEKNLSHTMSTKEMSEVRAISVQQDSLLNIGYVKPNKLMCIKFIE